jgi:hypothetical protein
MDRRRTQITPPALAWRGFFFALPINQPGVAVDAATAGDIGSPRRKTG